MDAKPYQPGQQLPGTVYRVVRHLATGGMGSVYDVEDVTVGKRYVLKTLLPQLVARQDLARRMEAEARTLAKLEHPNIVDVVTAGVTAGDIRMPFYVMERLNGQNLRVVLDKKSALELSHCYRIAIDLLDALGHAHENAVIHRDVKPENVFLHRNPTGTTITKLLDFGIMRLLDRKSSQTQGKFIGTLRYASPEQVMGDELGPATDIYSLGVVLYEMICGRGPFDDVGDVYAIGAAHAQRTPPALSRFVHVPRAVEELVMSALAKNPAGRPRDCFVMAAELRRLRQSVEHAQGVPASAGDGLQSALLSSRPPATPLMQGNAPPRAEPPQAAYQPTVGDTFVEPSLRPSSPPSMAPQALAGTLAAPYAPSAPSSPPAAVAHAAPVVPPGAGPAQFPRTVRLEPVSEGPSALPMTTQLLLGQPDRVVDRSAPTHASSPFGTTRRMATHDTLMEDLGASSRDGDIVRRAFDERMPLEVLRPNESGVSDLVFPETRTTPATTGEGLLVGAPRPRQERKFVVPLLAALAFALVTAGVLFLTSPRPASSAANQPEATTPIAPIAPMTRASEAPTEPLAPSLSPTPEAPAGTVASAVPVGTASVALAHAHGSTPRSSDVTRVAGKVPTKGTSAETEGKMAPKNAGETPSQPAGSRAPGSTPKAPLSPDDVKFE